MKDNELREKSAEELVAELGDLQRQQFALRMAQATGQLNQNNKLGLVRKNIARVKTVLTEKQGN